MLCNKPQNSMAHSNIHAVTYGFAIDCSLLIKIGLTWVLLHQVSDQLDLTCACIWVHICSWYVYSEDQIEEDALLGADHRETGSMISHTSTLKVPIPAMPGDIPLAKASHMATLTQ